jgi:hypothetical protein
MEARLLFQAINSLYIAYKSNICQLFYNININKLLNGIFWRYTCLDSGGQKAAIRILDGILR